ncbi:MAG: lipopolysaccharide biosynthesis protein [Nitrososphaerales archaeon]
MKDRLAKSVYWVVLSRGMVQVLSFCAALVVARLLHPEDYGLMALVGVLTIPLGLINEMGLGAAIIQFRDLKKTELNMCFWLNFSLAGIGYLVLYTVAPVVAAWFSTPGLTSVLRVAGLILPFTAIRVVPDSLLRKKLHFEKVSQAEIVSTVASIAVTMGLAWTGAGVWALVAGCLVMSLTQSLTTIWFAQWWPGVQFGRERLNEILRFSFATLGSRICFVGHQLADTIVLGKMAGEVALGFYSMAKELATLPVEKVSAVVNQLALPVMAELQTNQDALRASFLRTVRFLAWVTFPMCIGLILVAQDLVQVALTEKWKEAVPIIQVLCLYAMFRSVDALLPVVLVVKYRTTFLFINTLILLLIMPFAFWCGAVWSGSMGVAAAWVVIYPILRAGIAQVALGEIDVSWGVLWEQLWPPIFATAVMLSTVLMVHTGISSWDSSHAAARLVVISLSGAAVYLICLFGFGGSTKVEIQEVVGWVFRRGRVASKSNRNGSDDLGMADRLLGVASRGGAWKLCQNRRMRKGDRR